MWFLMAWGISEWVGLVAENVGSVWRYCDVRVVGLIPTTFDVVVRIGLGM